ncbi:MAG TPA: AMP-binding protein [Planctomycetota bacterium]|jgi:long-chain acyl-CoA synthetase|nr:AMP-binding protein [Planctomycetota bacterium]HNS00684.1 AMP-binding protein [Planctomycetota bacterium]HNU27472.1 AMP-binding protein [Planctomycetota bacterium]HOE31481.1 AMP-binding protein [Planctomycetota bacterium]HOR69035.1 AMP-binding protein [Planctomycetota bacterium]
MKAGRPGDAVMITEQIARWARERPGVVALQTFGGGDPIRLDYARLRERIAAAAALLRAAGTGPGDRVALFAGDGPEWALAYLAIHATGAAVIPLDAQYGVPELKVLLDFAAPKAVIADAARRAKIEAACAAPLWELGSLRGAGAPGLVAAPPAPEFVPHAHAPEDLMALLFTSGTTGDPKAVQLTCANIHANIEGILRGIRVTDKDNLLHVLPLHHAYAATVGLLVPLAAGATVTFCASLKGPDLVAAMQTTAVTVLPGVPQLFVLFDRAIFQQIDALPLPPRALFWTLYALARALRRATGLRVGRFFFRAIHRRFGPRFRLCASGGAKLDPAVAERFLNLGILMLEGYGLTETSPVISFTPYRRPRPGSVGRPLHNVEVRIDAPEGAGEICVRGPAVTPGYYLRDDATAEVIKDGWFHTGDLGFLDADGMIHITGRAKEVIVLASGKNIYPDDVEKHYENTLFVKEICIAPHADEGGAAGGLRAIVVPDEAALAERKVANPRERIRAELAKTAAALPSYMRCADVVLYAGEFPRTRLGKLKRAEIAARLAGRSREGAAGQPAEPAPEARALLEHPSAARFLARLAETIAAKQPLHPAQDLEFDLGVDSLTQIQITAVLEDEFGVVIPDEERAAVRTVGDFLARIAAAGGAGAAGAGAARDDGLGRYSWAARLAGPVDPPLEARFNLARGAAKRLLVRGVKTLAMLLLRPAFRTRLEGAAKLPREGPFIICPNHVSYLDPILVYVLFPMRVVHRLLFVAFGEIFRRAPLSWIVRFARLIPTGGADTTETSLRLAYQGLRRGLHVCIFPEGGRATTPGEIQAPRPGAAILAIETGAPIVPVRIDGAEKTLSTFHPGFRLCRVAVAIGDPIAPPAKDCGDPQAAHQELMRAWREAIARLAPAEEARHV